ncbi:ATP-dependent 6-phosphofructokinase [Myxococcota bacterium]|nr:ATP-dependent 6-phosphofructokinase [Myxococcota bacterium]
MATHRIGIMTGGGDAPGLNAVIRAVVKYAVGELHWQVVGIEDAFNGLLEHPRRLQDLTPKSCKGLLPQGGTILGTTNKGDPFAWPDGNGGVRDRSAELAEAIREEGLEGIISIGGDGSQAIGWRLMQEQGVPIVGVPKTIDNDLAATDFTFGFWSAVEVATEALDRLHTTADAHDRVMLLEVMGRTAGWIALYAGVAGGADVITLPEIDYDPERICAKIQQRKDRGRNFTLIVVAEGSTPATGEALPSARRHGRGHIVAGGAAQTLAQHITERLHVETRVTVLGHLQRGGSPVPFDRVLATRFGVRAVELIEQGRWGRMVRLRDGMITDVPLAEVARDPRIVSLDHPLFDAARKVGIEFGAAL